jgi:methionine--tRNA ligase beta chain
LIGCALYYISGVIKAHLLISINVEAIGNIDPIGYVLVSSFLLYDITMITIDEFRNIEIKIGRVKSVEKVEGADKLLKFIFDLGGEERQILSGIAEFYTDLEALVGQEMPVLVNLEPRTIRGLESRGMILCADAGGRAVLLHPELDVPPGSAVK